MKALDVEERLESILPLLTGRFSDNLSILSIVPAALVATATTSAVHGLTTGDKVYVQGANAAVGITSISRSGAVATAITTQNHDLTEGTFTEVILDGATEAEFNGTFPLLSVPSRNKFTFTVADSGPTTVTGSPILEEPGLPFGYNGLQEVTGTPSVTTFTYTLTQALPENAAGTNMRVIKGLRIHSAISQSRANEVFESSDVDNLTGGQLMLFVILGGGTANRDRNTLTDGVSTGGASGDNRQQMFENVACTVYQKVTNNLTAAGAMDDMQDIVKSIIQSLAGWVPPNDYARPSKVPLKFLSHGLLEYDTAIYTHVVEFQSHTDISTEDLQNVPVDVAFRDIALTLTNVPGKEPYTATIDLDDEPAS